MSAQVIRVRADVSMTSSTRSRRLVRDDELSTILSTIELRHSIVTQAPTARGLNITGLAAQTIELFDALDAHPPSDRVERARALLTESIHALDALVTRDNRPPCPVIRLLPAAKVPDPPAPGPGRGKKKHRPQGGHSFHDRPPSHTSDAQLRAIAERAPEPVRDRRGPRG